MSTLRARKSNSRGNSGRDLGRSKSLMPRDDLLDVSDILNFSLPPRHSVPSGGPARRGRRSGLFQPTWSREKFVNAQYRFVMKPTGDYVAYFADPDIYFQWSDIEQVILPRRSASAILGSSDHELDHDNGSTCPICLSPPVAPRMTKCGHIFCFSCFLHYLATSQTRWHRCPICFDSITESQLKNVKWLDPPPSLAVSQAHKGGEKSSDSKSFVTLRLMERPQITTLALPRSNSWPSSALPPLRAPFHFAPDVYDYAKFMLATPEYLREALGADTVALSADLELCRVSGDELGAIYVEMAMDKVKQQIEDVQLLETPTIKREVEHTRNSVQLLAKRRAEIAISIPSATDPRDEAPDQYLATLSPLPSSHLAIAQPRKGQRKNVNPPPPSNSSYFFYQAAGGLPIFLHPLDIRILLSKFSSYSSFPSEITVPINAFEEGTVNDDLRKRCKYLAHLPESADVVFLETDLEPVVGKDGLKAFEAALKTRRTKRHERHRREERNRVRAEEREREKERQTGLWRDMDFLPRSPVEDVRSDSPAFEGGTDQMPPNLSGAWGSRSFAAAAHTSTPPARPMTDSRVAEDELQLEQALNELELRQTGGRKKGRGVKLVVLGGAGGRRR